MVLRSLIAKTVAIFIAQKVFPSPETEEVINNVFAPSTPCFLYINCKLDRNPLKPSEIEDLGLSKTARLLSILLLPIIPRIGMGDNRSTS